MDFVEMPDRKPSPFSKTIGFERRSKFAVRGLRRAALRAAAGVLRFALSYSNAGSDVLAAVSSIDVRTKQGESQPVPNDRRQLRIISPAQPEHVAFG
jgi:hypothetical protein